MKNLLVRSLYRIKSTKWFRDRAEEGDLYDLYHQMHEISLESFEKHLQGDWEFVFYNKEVDNIQEVFRDHFFEIYDLWKSGCNILYCGPDNFMTQDTSFYGEYSDFRMFNYTDPKQFRHFEHFLNADVRYYSADMDPDTWCKPLEAAKNWDFSEWNTEQIILNDMLWSQADRTPENTIMPHMAYQGHLLGRDIRTLQYSNAWNGIDIRQAHIIHLHGSRNAPEKLALMQDFKRQHEVLVL